MKQIFLDRVWATLASGINNTQTTLPLTAGHGARFGTIPAGSAVLIMLLNASDNVAETLLLTAISGDNGTIVRGTPAASHLAGARLEVRLSNISLANLIQKEDIQPGAETLLGTVAGTNTITAAATPTLQAQAATGSVWKAFAAGANTGATTLNIDGQGAVSVVRPDGAALQKNDIAGANYPCIFIKRAADFVLQNPANLIAQTAYDMIRQTGTAFTTAGTSTAFTLTPSLALTAYAAGQRFRVKFHATAGAAPTINISGLGAKSLKQYDDAGNKVACSAQTIIANLLSDVEYDGTDAVVLDALSVNKTEEIIPTIGAAIGSNTLTLSLQPDSLYFRSATLNDGTVNQRVVASALSLVISSGSTLGTISGQESRIAVLAIDNAGTVELAAVNLAGGTSLNEKGLISTTAEGGAGAADSATTIYSATARANVPYRVLGYIKSTQTTAGAWAQAITQIQGCGGQSLSALDSIGQGQTYQTVTRTSGTTYYNTTGKPIFLIRNLYTGSAYSGYTSISINGAAAFIFGYGGTYIDPGYAEHFTGSVIIPPGASYVITDTNAYQTSTIELR